MNNLFFTCTPSIKTMYYKQSSHRIDKDGDFKPKKAVIIDLRGYNTLFYRIFGIF
jgi:hypothetical protein